jgi:Carboxypeptidase regulatory-like domain
MHGRGHPNATASDVERERRRVAAFDPSFDHTKPGGAMVGLVTDPEGKPVAGALVAAIRRPGRDELPTFSRPVPRVVTTGNDGRFQIADVLAGEYGVTATAPVDRPRARTRRPSPRVTPPS